MNGGHITFDRLSRFHDGDVISAAERKEIEKHLEACELCKNELLKIQRLVGMISCLGSLGIRSGRDFAEGTMRMIACRPVANRFDRGTRLVRRHFVPASAVAAIIVAVVGISIFSTDSLHNTMSRQQLARQEYRYDAPTQADPSARVMQMIRNSNATVLGVTGSHVIGETSAANLAALRRNLAGYRIQIIDSPADRDFVAVSAQGGNEGFRGARQGGVRFKVIVRQD
jgi:anti-sigma factor RsiW